MDTLYKKCAKLAVYHELQQGLQPFVWWHVTESIQEGYSPESIGALQEEAEVEALVLERRSAARDGALGLFISLFHHYLAQQTGPADIQAALKALKLDLDKDAPAASFVNFHLDTSDLYEYVEQQKQNAGYICDDPDWHPRPNTSAKLQWHTIFRKSLELTRTAYVEACSRFRPQFAAGAEADLALVQLLPVEQLTRLIAECRARPLHTVGPLSTSNESSVNISTFWTQRLASASSSVRAVMPGYNPAHLIIAGQQFREGCNRHIRAQPAAHLHASPNAEQVTAVLSHATNPETHPGRLVDCARQRLDASIQSSPDEEALIRNAKDKLSSALRILSMRDGTRNVSLRIDAHNLRGGVNLRLASLKPHSEANYLCRAVADWSASLALDEDQPHICKELADARSRLEILKQESENKSPDSTISQPHASSATPATISAEVPPANSEQANTNAPAASASIRATDINEVKPSKPREKTILESPFFRSDLVTGLMVDSLLALPFPHRALRETLRFPSAAEVAAATQDHVPMLDRLAKAHQQITKALTHENKTQLKEAIKAVSAVLALPQLQQVSRDDSSEKVLRATSLRLVLGTLFLLSNDLIKAQTELDLVSNVLKPNSRSKGNARDRKGKHGTPGAEGQQLGSEAVQTNNAAREISSGAAIQKEAGPEAGDESIRKMQTRVQGEALFLLAKTCWMNNKSQESLKFFRWFAKWYTDQQTSMATPEIQVAPLDLAWWDKLLVVTKE